VLLYFAARFVYSQLSTFPLPPMFSNYMTLNRTTISVAFLITHANIPWPHLSTPNLICRTGRLRRRDLDLFQVQSSLSAAPRSTATRYWGNLLQRCFHCHG